MTHSHASPSLSTVHRMSLCLGACTPQPPRLPEYFILPDLVSHCPFPLTCHSDCDEVALESVAWLLEFCPYLTLKQRNALFGLQAGELTAFCYPTTSAPRLRVVSDFMNYLFHLDNISDKMMSKETETLANAVMNALWFHESYSPPMKLGTENAVDEIDAGKLARDFWTRCIPDASSGMQLRFKESLHQFFEAVQVQARARTTGLVMDLESYIDIRRDTSGCKPVFDLIEYALGLDLPEFVVQDPIVRALNQSANDLVTWSNDIFSFNREQSREDETHNMVSILMQHHGHNLQSAVDYVGELCKQTIDAFIYNRSRLPSWGTNVDIMAQGYVQGLQDWIVGSLHWSFMTTRYFGKEGVEVKKTRIVKVLPRAS